MLHTCTCTRTTLSHYTNMKTTINSLHHQACSRVTSVTHVHINTLILTNILGPVGNTDVLPISWHITPLQHFQDTERSSRNEGRGRLTSTVSPCIAITSLSLTCTCTCNAVFIYMGEALSIATYNYCYLIIRLLSIYYRDKYNFWKVH